MSNMSERSQGSNPLEALHASRRVRERTEAPRLAPVNEPASGRAPRPDSVRPIIPLSERLESTFPQSVRHGMEEDEPEPDDFKSEGLRWKVFAGVIGGGVAVAVASVVALLLVNVFPKDKDADQSFAVAAPPAAPQSL